MLLYSTVVMITPYLFVILNMYIMIYNIIMQVYFVLRKDLLQAGILELDTLFSLLSTLDMDHN